MKKNIYHTITRAAVIIVCLICSEFSFAQIEIRGLESNPVLKEQKKPLARKQVQYLSLPFFEDFSDLSSPYPNTGRWRDQQVFINATFPILPPSIGAATLDALDENGLLYEQASIYSFDADTLTSQYIRLDSVFLPLQRALTIQDSIYFSFYYQPGGGFGPAWEAYRKGNAPRPNDLLILEFYSPKTDKWVEVWNTQGQTLDAFCPLCSTDTTDQAKDFFKQVLIPITDSNYLGKDFHFRFRNLSSMDSWGSSGTQWHIDYIKLDYNRHYNDIFSLDISFTEPATSLLKEFQAIPAKQFHASDLKSEIRILFKNLGEAEPSSVYHYDIIDKNNAIVNTIPSDGNANATIYPFFTDGFNSDPDISRQNVSYTFPNLNSGNDVFRIRHQLSTPNDLFHSNDTTVFTQRFEDYYAYDDGTPEASAGVNFANGTIAYRFPLRVSDTLSAIDIFFNPTTTDMTWAYLHLMVWEAINDSTPAETPIYTSDRIKPNYDTSGFQRFEIPTLILQQGDFFIGIKQTTSAFTNIGFDQNSNAQGKLFFFKEDRNEWLPFIDYGALMMRPVFGASHASNAQKQFTNNIIHISPNPVSNGEFNIYADDALISYYEIFNINGQKVLERKCQGNSHVSCRLDAPKGIYFIRVSTDKGYFTQKIVLN